MTERAAAVTGKLEGAMLGADGTQIGLAWRQLPPDETVRSGATLLSELAGGSPSVGAVR